MKKYWHEKIINRLMPRHSFVRKVGILASGTAVAQIITICVMPIVTRIYSPEQLGTITLFLSFFFWWASTLSFRYENALLIAENDGESHDLYHLALVLVGITSFVGLPVLWFLRKNGVFEFNLLPDWSLIIVSPMLLGYGIFTTTRAWALRARLISDITRSNIIRAIVNSGVRILLGLVGWGVLGLFVAELVAAYASVVRLCMITSRYFSVSKPAKISYDRIKKVARKYYKFPILEAPATWLDALTLVLPVPMIAALYGPTEAGWFALARMIVGAPNSQIGAAVADVFQMEMANAVQNRDAAYAYQLFYMLIRKMALLGLVPLIAIVSLAPWVMSMIFGSEWAESGYVSALIAPWFYVALIVIPLSRTFSVLQVQEYKFITDGLSLAMLAVVFLLGKLHEPSFLQFIGLMAFGNILSTVVYAILLKKIINIRMGNGF